MAMPAFARQIEAAKLPATRPGSDAALSPSTFRERGVVLPATTPAFAFARVRDGAQGRELVLRNAGGSGGAVLIPLAAAADYARPTLHDRTLFADIACLPRLSPAHVAAVARAAARAGLAGRAALAAAGMAAEAEAKAASGALGAILAALAGRPSAEAEEDPKCVATSSHPAITAAAAALGHPPETVLAAAAELAAAAALADRLAHLLPELRVFATTAGDAAARLTDAQAKETRFAAAAAAATAGFAATALAGLTDAFAAPERALARALADQSWPGEAVARAGWILDGWQALIARWHDAEGQGQGAEQRAFRAIAAALPPLPAELACTEADNAALRATWRSEIAAQPGLNDQALLERLRVAAP